MKKNSEKRDRKILAILLSLALFFSSFMSRDILASQTKEEENAGSEISEDEGAEDAASEDEMSQDRESGDGDTQEEHAEEDNSETDLSDGEETGEDDLEEYLNEAQNALKKISDKEILMALVYLCEEYPVKKAADAEGETVVRVPTGTTVFLKGVGFDQDYNIWYQVSAEHGGDTFTGYIQREYLAYSNELFLEWEDTYFPKMAMFAANTTSFPDVEQFPASWQDRLMRLKQAHPNWIFVRQNTGLEWKSVVTQELYKDRSLISGVMGAAYKGQKHSPGWYYATEDAVKYYLDPRNFLDDTRIFQFEQLTYNPSYHTTKAVQNILDSTFMKGELPKAGMNYADAFFQIGVSLKVSPFHLACRVYQEQGKGDSALISGTYDVVPEYKGYYNYFNISAAGTTTKQVIETGLAKARAEGWNTPYASLKGGAEIISRSYIRRGQDTLYLQKFDVDASDGTLYTHQYMQNIMAPYTESSMVKKAYGNTGALENPFVFKIPVYNHMPELPCPVPSQVTTPTASPVATVKPVVSPTAKATPASSPTSAVTPSASPTAKVTPSANPTATASPSPMAKATPTASPTATASPSPTVKATPTASPTATASPSPTAKVTPTANPTATASPSPTAKVTPTASPTATASPSPTAKATPTASPTATASPSPTAKVTPTASPTAAALSSPTPKTVPTANPVASALASATPTAGQTATVSPKETPAARPTAAVTATAMPKATATASASPVTTMKPTATPTESPVATKQPTATSAVTPAETTSTAKPQATPKETSAAAETTEKPVSTQEAGSTTPGPSTTPVAVAGAEQTEQPSSAKGTEGETGPSAGITENTSSTGVTVAAATPRPHTASGERSSLTMDMSRTSMIYAQTLRQIREQGMEVILELGDDVSWTIDGSTMEGEEFGDIDLAVSLGKSGIPEDRLAIFTENENYVEMKLAHEGEFGFDTILTIVLDRAWADRYANLFYYNPETEEFEFMCASLISSSGRAAFEFRHASDYVIIISDATRETLPQEKAGALEEARVREQEAIVKAREELPAEEPGKAAGIIALILLGSAALGIGVYLILKWKKEE